jgi:hypothetical protein
MAKKQSKKTETKYQGNDPLIASMCNAIPADMDMLESVEEFIAYALRMVLERESLDTDLRIDKYGDRVTASFTQSIPHYDGSGTIEVEVKLAVTHAGVKAEFDAETYHGGGWYTENDLTIDTFGGLRDVILRRCHEALVGAWEETAKDVQENIKYLKNKLATGKFDE